MQGGGRREGESSVWTWQRVATAAVLQFCFNYRSNSDTTQFKDAQFPPAAPQLLFAASSSCRLSCPFGGTLQSSLSP